MKREGRQHGMVRTNCILQLPGDSRSKSKYINRMTESPATAGLFTKVNSKPTNNSKFTSRCGRARCEGCHVHPAWKSRDKSKGTQKLKSGDVAINHRLVAWRVVDKGHGSGFAGISATAILGHLSNDYGDYDDEVEEEDYDDDVNADFDVSIALEESLAAKFRYVEEEKEEEEEVEIGLGAKIEEEEDCDNNNMNVDFDVSTALAESLAAEFRYVEDEEEDEEEEIGSGAKIVEEEEEEDDNMGFCDVGFVMEQVDGEEGWCLVGEM